MLAAIIVVFREMLELCLILGIISAALKNNTNRIRLVCAGVASGAMLCTMLALAFSYITNLFNGNGQEILNIIILSISIISISLTMLWIKEHAKNIYNKLSENYLDSLPVILIIALAISREGAEIILFLHGIAAAGSNITNIIMGSIIGVSLGAVIGGLIYVGLVKIPAHYFFKVINILLILLAAGMASQLANYLSAINAIEILSTQIWDSSWLIEDNTIIGRILHGLMGYSSHPTKLQVLFYFTTIAVISSLPKLVQKSTNN